MIDFQTHTCGKWILAGEHAVLRGSRALAFPLLARNLELSYRTSDEKLDVRTEGVQYDVLQASVLRALRRAIELLDLRVPLRGALRLINHLPCGAGLGASAALCVALARWFQSGGHLSLGAVYSFARELEDLFHGQSSGLDIAVALREHSVSFAADSGAAPFEAGWQPRLYLSDSGARAETSECVNKVKSLLQAHPVEGQAIDADMRAAVERCATALQKQHPSAVEDLAAGIDLAASCFRRWQLIDPQLEEHMQSLLHAGACAAKPTGAGGGGYVLSLWRDAPPASARERLIPCFGA